MTSKGTIKIACQGSGFMDVSDMRPFQGELKSLSETDYAKLKAQILDNGFSFPIAVWQHKSQHFLLDGHQRQRVLTKMREDGYEIPEVPVNHIEADSFEQAKRKLLSAVAQYGRVESQGLYEFMQESDIGMDELYETVRIPDMNLDFFRAEFFDMPPPPEDEQKSGSTELGKDEFTGFDHTCPRCGFEWSGGKPRTEAAGDAEP